MTAFPDEGDDELPADHAPVIRRISMVGDDPKATRTISAKTHHMDVDYSCYEGRQVRGRSDIVLSRGSVIVRDGQFTGRKGAGKFLKRSTADYARIN